MAKLMSTCIHFSLIAAVSFSAAAACTTAEEAETKQVGDEVALMKLRDTVRWLLNNEGSQLVTLRDVTIRLTHEQVRSYLALDCGIFDIARGIWCGIFECMMPMCFGDTVPEIDFETQEQQEKRSGLVQANWSCLSMVGDAYQQICAAPGMHVETGGAQVSVVDCDDPSSIERACTDAFNAVSCPEYKPIAYCALQDYDCYDFQGDSNNYPCTEMAPSASGTVKTIKVLTSCSDTCL